jgi:Tfp pilus assembly protein PilO
MRLNFIIVVVIIAALIAGGYFGINYYRKSTTTNELQEQIDVSEQQIQALIISSENLAKEIDNLKNEQATIQDAITAKNTNIPLMTNSNEVIRNIMELGLRNGTNVIPLSNSGWVDVKIQQVDYHELTLTLTVEARQQNIINFVRGLQDLYPTLVIENIRISVPMVAQTPDSGIPGETTTDDRIQSNITIAIYAR